MDRTIKPLKDDSAEPEAGEETRPPASSLSDFLAGGLRESQRPPPPGRESQRPSGVVRTSQPPANPPLEREPPAGHAVEAETAEPPAAEEAGEATRGEDGHGDDGVATAALAAQAPVDALADESSIDEAAPLEDGSIEAPAGIARTESDYVVPVPLLARPRLVAGAVAAALLIIGLVFWLSRETKAPPRVDVPRETPATVAHEPLPPGPPAVDDPIEPIPEMGDEPAAEAPKVTGGAAPAPAESGVTPPFGPNVARYPDLPTPVLLQLEKDQEEKAATKKK
jgi:hypothetical protein